MNLTTLQYFREVARSEQVTRSARALNVAQPALSRAIKKLEEEVGKELFIRQNNRITLNKYGRRLLQAADNIVGEWESALAEINDSGADQAQVITIQVSSAGASVADMLKQFQARCPQATFVVHSRPGNGDGSADCDLSLFATVNESEPPAVMLRREQLFLSMGPNHPLANKKGVMLRDLADQPFLFSDEANDMYAIQSYYCSLAGFTPRIVLKTDKQNILVNMLQLNQGVELQPKLPPTAFTVGIAQKPVLDIQCFRYIHLLLNSCREPSPLVRQFYDFCVDYFSHGEDS